MEVANSLLESFREPPNPSWQIPVVPPGTHISHWFVQTIGLLTWHSLCFNHLVLSTFWQCRSAIPQRSVKPIASIHYTVPHCVVDAGHGLGRSLGNCRPALPKGWMYQMVKTQTQSHIRRPVVWTNRWQIWVFFSFEFLRGTARICHTSLWGFSEAL